jgi:AAA+ ATPase superfamily predicted ATPase
MKHIAFIGRQQQLEKLKRLLRKKTSNLVVIRGRRRIGKSRLVEEFAKKMTFLSFSGLAPSVGTTAQLQRDEFARQLEDQLGIRGVKSEDWGDMFTFLAKSTSKSQTIVLLDEITWMGSMDPAFLGKLKIAWDLHFSKNSKLMLILCGSVSAWIEKNILSSTGFFGRISQKILLEELSLISCNKLLDVLGFKGSSMEKLMILSVIGGVPWYLELINPTMSAVENIKQLCFERDGILVNEFENIFHDLFGKRSEIYQRIVKHLIDGPAEYKEISKALEYPSGGPLSEYLNELVLSGYVSCDHAWNLKTGKERRIFQYRLSDNYLRFYLKYIEPNYNKIKNNHFEFQSLSDLPGFNSIMGYQVENLVLHNRQLILERLRIDPSDIVYDNPYHQHKTTKQSGCQIDYLIQTRFNTLYVCEVKFSKLEVPFSIIEEMKEKIHRLKYPKGFSCLPVLIHVNGVSESVKDAEYFIENIDLTSLMSE